MASANPGSCRPQGRPQNRTQPGRRGLMLVLSSPSGAGKTTIARQLLEADGGLELSISVTTRAQRRGERDGRDYRFIDRARFAAMIAAGQLIEHATVFGHGYGTPRAPVMEALAAGRDVLFDIDWQGARQLRQAFARDVVSVFVLPPSAGELARRLETRASDSPEVRRRRMAGASGEMAHWRSYDYIVVNRQIEASVASVLAVLHAERLRRRRLDGMKNFVATLRRDLDTR